MKNKNTYLIIILLIVVVGAIFYFNHRLNAIEMAIENKGRIIKIPNITQNVMTAIKIDKIEGNGNVFGDYNKIENKIA